MVTGYFILETPFVRAQDVFGCSSLWLAAQSGMPETVQFLLQAGADPETPEVVREDASVSCATNCMKKKTISNLPPILAHYVNFKI